MTNLTPSITTLQIDLDMQRKKEQRLLSELAECQALITSHTTLIEIAKGYEFTNTE